MSIKRSALIVGFFALVGLSVLAETSIPFSFEAGQPIKADEVNANFAALNDSKQNTITGSPCAEGQFVTGIGSDGAISCGIDQIGSAGSSGVSSLNGQTGSMVIEGANGISVETSEDGKVTISADANSHELATQATVALPATGTISSANPAFAITNNGGGIAVQGSSPSGTGVQGTTSTAYGVVGSASGSAGVGIYGKHIPNNANYPGTGVAGRADNANAIGVSGTSTRGTGVQGTSSVYVGVFGQSTQGIGVKGTSSANVAVSGSIYSSTAGVNSIAVDGVNDGQYGYGVRGIHKGSGYGVYGNSPATGVGGESATGIGVYGKGPKAMYAAGDVVQSTGSGWAKALIVLSNGNIMRCYNGITGSRANTCGFTSSRVSRGDYTVNFGFDITNLFYSASSIPSSQGYSWLTRITEINGSTLRVILQGTDFSMRDGRVSIMVF
ncbi:MAG: hypothetical protein KC422_14540 [Trueperaceae bacterium]|nr:hypothetical protein [Trueperaceae bacterium]